MKYLIVLLVVVVVGWLWLRGRTRQAPAAPDAAPTPPRLQEVVACRHCGMHLPRGEALEDSRGAFCSEAHRLAGPASP
jgi:uncharacterized protein